MSNLKNKYSKSKSSKELKYQYQKVDVNIK